MTGEFTKPGGQAPDQAVRAVRPDVVVEHVGEQREDDREPDQVDEDRQEQNAERCPTRFGGRGIGRWG